MTCDEGRSGSGITENIDTTDNGNCSCQVSYDGQNIFRRLVISMYDLPDNGGCRTKQRNTYHT